MPAKSNKFDYTNRTSKGLKLGQIIGHALEKEAERILREGRKHSQKTHKQNGALGEAYTHTTHLDIRAPSGHLTDDGVFALVSGLEAAYSKGTDQVKLALEDLNLADNAITTASLRRLSPVIVHCGKTLRTLTLSHNNIRVETAEEAEDWIHFLQAFEHCTAFQRLELTGNKMLTPKALELFAELHISSKDVPPIMADRAAPVQASESDRNIHVSQHGIFEPQSPNTDPTATHERRSGLRSIPYIIFDEVALTDGGAMWLSYIVENHFFPCQLIDGVDHSSPDMRQNLEARGISWNESSSTLGKEGKHILDLASRLRGRLLDNESALASSSEDERPGSLCRSRFGSRARDESVGAIDQEDQTIRSLKQARRKVQSSIIVANRACSVDLWRAALRVVVFSRAFMAAVEVDFLHRSAPSDSGQMSPCGRASLPMHRRVQAQAGTHQQSFTSGIELKRSLTGRALLWTRNHLRQPRNEMIVAVTSATPPNGVKSPQNDRKSAFAGEDDYARTEQKLCDSELSDPDGFAEAQKRHVEKTAQNALGSENVSSHISFELLKIVIKYTLSNRERSALTAEQFDKAFAWGQNRDTLSKEQEWCKDRDSVQVVKLLESITCLEYARKSLS